MTVQIPVRSYRSIVLGQQVIRAAAALPQTTQAPIFTIAGGFVIVTSFVGIVTTDIQAQPTTVQFIATPTVGASQPMTTAGADINAKPVGTMVMLPTTFAGTLPATLSSGVGALGFPSIVNGIVMQTGTLDFKTVASSTGAMRFLLTYIPLDDGATVVAA